MRKLTAFVGHCELRLESDPGFEGGDIFKIPLAHLVDRGDGVPDGLRGLVECLFNNNRSFIDHKFGFAVGRLASDVYSDSFVFSTFSRGYLNRSFLFNPTQGSTGVGSLGAVAKGFVTDQNWVGGHLYDGNAVSGDFDLNSFMQHEWLKENEIGWALSFASRPTDRIQFLYWYKDERVEAGVTSGKGWVVTASYQTGEKFLSFFRVGRSNGGAAVPAEKTASTGVENSPRLGRALTVGLGWAKPS